MSGGVGWGRGVMFISAAPDMARGVESGRLGSCLLLSVCGSFI